MRQPLAQTFRETAAAAYKTFPHELKKLVVLLVPASYAPAYISPYLVDKLTKRTMAIKKAVKKLGHSMHAQKAAGIAPRNYNLAGITVHMIALDMNVSDNFSARYTKEMHLLFHLDHEIGHHILKNGYSTSGNLAESAADAYAMLRHIQRFGKNTAVAGERSCNGAYCIILGADSEHYTTDALQRAVQLSKERNISGLSLRETAALADKIASQYSLNDTALKKIRKAFLPVHRIYDPHKDDWVHIYKEIIFVMRKYSHDPDVFNAGKRFFNHPLTKKFMAESAKTNPYWQEALSFINAPETKARAKPSAHRLSLSV